MGSAYRGVRTGPRARQLACSLWPSRSSETTPPHRPRTHTGRRNLRRGETPAAGCPRAKGASVALGAEAHARSEDEDMTSDPDGRTRREILIGGVAAIAGAALPAQAQTPRRGGVFRLSLGDPPHFDPHLTLSWGTFIALSFSHSRLLKHRAGPGVAPGTFQLEGDLAESWAQTSETTYVFKLRRGVRWHPKPPVNGRELTADDVKFSV